jgi:hypothetical protein
MDLYSILDMYSTFRKDVDWDIQHGNGRAAWTRTNSMDMDMQNGHGYGHAAWTRT